MLAAGAFALTMTDVTFSAPPPRRPDQAGRSGRSVGSLLRAAHRELALALSDTDTWMPRVSARYPY